MAAAFNRDTLKGTIVSFMALCQLHGWRPAIWDEKKKVFDYSGTHRLQYSKESGLTLEKMTEGKKAIEIIMFGMTPREFINAVTMILNIEKSKQQ